MNHACTKTKARRDPRPGSFVLLQKAVGEEFVLSSMSGQTGELVGLHKRLFLGKVDPRIVHWFAQNRIGDGVTFSRSQRTIQLVHGVKRWLSAFSRCHGWAVMPLLESRR